MVRCQTMFIVGLPFLAVVFTSLMSFGHAQAPVPYPVWAESAPEGGGFVPPEYVGSVPGLCTRQIPKHIRLPLYTLQVNVSATPASGVIAFEDKRGAVIQRSGWDTGLDRVYFMSRTSAADAWPIVIDCVGWNGSVGKAECYYITVSSGLSVTQSVPIAASAVAEIWGASGVVGGDLYLYDLSSHSIRRRSDPDQDGVFDFIDNTFVLSVPTSWAPDNTLESDVALRFSGIRAFRDPVGPGPLLRLSMRNFKAPIDILVDPAGTPFFSIPSTTTAIPRLQIVGTLVVGQKRILVAGTPQTAFIVVQRDLVTSAETVIANGWTIRSSGEIIVDLTIDVAADVEIFLRANTGGHESPPLVPAPFKDVSLLHPFERILEEGCTYTFFGDRLSSNVQAVLIHPDGSTSILQTNWLKSSTRIGIEIPDLGSSGIGSVNKIKMMLVFLERASQPGQPISQAVAIQVKYK